MPDEALQFQSLTKTFPGVRALDTVSFAVRARSIHALMGENGAGKSTLLKILSGAQKPDSGNILLNGQPHIFASPSAAHAAGVAVIYQELHLVPHLSVADNLFLGHLPSRMGFVVRRQLLDDARQQLDILGEDIDPRTLVHRLPIAQRQMVEIAKALTHNAGLIAFDEPTSSLSSREVDRLFAVIRQLRDNGRVILYVTHRMDEVFDLCDAATVLRDGKHVQTWESLAGVTRDQLVGAMVGRSIADVFQYQPRPHGDVLLRVDNLLGRGLVEPVSFDVKAGEIVGLFGLVGAGRTELLKLIYGAEKATAGGITVAGQVVHFTHPCQAIRQGLVLCPEDRKKEGVVAIRPVWENINISARRHFSPLGFFLHHSRENANARRYIDALSIKTPTIHQLTSRLSGGNQQKVILARWLAENPRVVLLDEPTRGIDVGAKAEIYAIIYELARRGAAVVVVSSELPEVLGVADRVLVMREGRLVASLDRDQATPHEVLSLALPASDPGQPPERIRA